MHFLAIKLKIDPVDVIVLWRGLALDIRVLVVYVSMKGVVVWGEVGGQGAQLEQE